MPTPSAASPLSSNRKQTSSAPSRTLPGASKIYELTDAPGGGKCVTFHDSVDGFPFHLVFGQQLRTNEVKAQEQAEELPNGNPMHLRFNFPEDKQRPRRTIPTLQESARARLQARTCGDVRD
jgi:hypothetical protein